MTTSHIGNVRFNITADTVIVNCRLFDDRATDEHFYGTTHSFAISRETLNVVKFDRDCSRSAEALRQCQKHKYIRKMVLKYKQAAA